MLDDLERLGTRRSRSRNKFICIYKNVPEKNVDTTFSQTLQWILCESRLAKNLNLLLGGEKSDKILQI